MKKVSTFRLDIFALLICLSLFTIGCSSTPTITGGLTQIEITGIGLVACESPVTITLYRDGFRPITHRPAVANGRVIFPAGTGQNGITVTGISVAVPNNCEPSGYHGTYEYSGGQFRLVSNQKKELDWDDFNKQ